MGTTYSIKASTHHQNLKFRVDSLLGSFNSVFSTYDTSSIISIINRTNDDSICFRDIESHFYNTLNLSKEVWENTQGYFDPTVMPLVKYWGFGPKKEALIQANPIEIDAILLNIGLDKLRWTKYDNQLCLFKSVEGLSIDLNAIAKGKGVDLICEMLQNLDIENYMVEIGGEVRVKGINDQQEFWKIGIDKPISTENLSNRQNQAIIQLKNQAIASSGNYRNFHQVDGEIVGHTINPISGYAEINDLLAVSVIADNCAKADAYATGFMAMGFEKAFNVAKEIESIKVLFIKLNEDGSDIELQSTNNFDASIVSVN
ncbi:MAG: FAD:protein FMN transferase [Chitinophagales bacterium]